MERQEPTTLTTVSHDLYLELTFAPDDSQNKVTKPCVTPEICYYEGVWIGQYMNTPWVREALDVPKKVPPFKCAPSIP